MKKLLLATTCFGLFAAGSASAAAPTIKLGGYADFQAGAADQESVYERGNNAAKGLTGTGSGEPGYGTRNPLHGPVNTATDMELYIDVEGETDFGLKYGAHITLEADVNAPGDAAQEGGTNAGKTYIFAETAYGRFEGGATTSPAYAMQVGAESLARATGGIAGDFHRYIDLDGSSLSTAGGRTFFVLPGLANDNNSVDIEKHRENLRRTANKYALYSPEFYGFQIGASYTPDTAERGSDAGFVSDVTTAGTPANVTHFEHLFDFGAKYKAQYSGVGVEASATGQVAEAKPVNGGGVNLDDLSSYNFGLLASYAGFSLAGSYGFADEFGRLAATNSELDYWTAGGSYVYGPFGASVTYLDSTIENDGSTADSEFQNLVVGADYQLAPGFVPYVEVSFFETDDNVAGNVDNEGTVFLSGIELTF